MIESFNSVLGYMPERIKTVLGFLNSEIKNNATEIRIRLGFPLVITGVFGSVKPMEFGSFVIITKAEMEELLLNLTKNSFYSYENDIKKGFLTLDEGHRVGIVGFAKVSNEEINSVYDISSVCIRIATKVLGAADEIFNNLIIKTKGSVLIAGPPGSGKTTILRELAEKLGDSVAIVDEREEIFGSLYFPLIKNGVDVLSGYPKEKGIEIATRCFAPKVIICDEITRNELEKIRYSISSGVRIIASAHAYSGKDLINKGYFDEGLFSEAVILKSSPPSVVKEIIKGEKNENYRNDSGSSFNNLGGILSSAETDFKGFRVR